MLRIKDNYKTLADGTSLMCLYSSTGKMIKEKATGKAYSSVVNIELSADNFVEMDIEAEDWAGEEDE